MKENTKRFFRNSLLSVLGFLLADAVMALSFRFDDSTPYARIASSVIIAVTAVGMFFYGYKMIKPMKAAWQTVLSVGVLPVSALLILAVFLTFVFETDFPGAILFIASNPFFSLLPAKFVLDDITATLILFLTPLLPFIYMSIGTAERSRLEKGAM